MDYYVTIELSTGKALSVNRRGFMNLDETKFVQYEISMAENNKDASDRAELVHAEILEVKAKCSNLTQENK